MQNFAYDTYCARRICARTDPTLAADNNLKLSQDETKEIFITPSRNKLAYSRRSLLRRGKRLGYCADDVPTVADLLSTADDDFFHRVKTNSNHLLQPYLPDQTDIPYQLRIRSHSMSLIDKAKFLNDAAFIIRLLYKCSY